MKSIDLSSPAEAFSKQAPHFDADESSNSILKEWRQQIYDHVDQYLKPGDRILELNAGTGIDALRFAKNNYAVHATDLSQGMIVEIEKKVIQHKLKQFTFEQCSFHKIDKINSAKFDYVFSNFGGLNCCSDLTSVTKLLPGLINPNSYVTWVIMPPICLWELLWVFKGKKAAFRRLKRNGTVAHLEGEYFKTYYHSLQNIKKSFGPKFKLIKTEGLGALSPPPASDSFAVKHKTINRWLNYLDKKARNSFPFNQWADHIIVTFKYIG